MIRRITLSSALLILLLTGACIQTQSGGEYEVTVAQVREKLNSGEDIVLLDVRTVSEYTGPLGHVDSSLLIPLNDLESRIGELEKFRDKEIIVICRTGINSGSATKILRENNFKAFNMLGGMVEWNNQHSEDKKEE